MSPAAVAGLVLVGVMEVATASLGLYLLLITHAYERCLAAAVLTESAYVVSVLAFAVLAGWHGVLLAVASIMAHALLLWFVYWAATHIVRRACHTEQSLLLEEVLVIRQQRDLEALRGTSSHAELALASLRVAHSLKEFVARVSHQRSLEYHQWQEAPERTWLAVLANVLVLSAAVFLVRVTTLRAIHWHVELPVPCC